MKFKSLTAIFFCNRLIIKPYKKIKTKLSGRL